MKIHKYFKLGDIVRNEDTWGKKLFVISAFGGNEYLSELYVHPFDEERKISNQCNWNVLDVKLVDAPQRPFRKVPKKKLIQLMSRGLVEARREFFIRTANKIKF